VCVCVCVRHVGVEGGLASSLLAHGQPGLVWLCWCSNFKTHTHCWRAKDTSAPLGASVACLCSHGPSSDVQGMAFAAGVLLMYLPEELAFR
jgi:hypothetical protein